MKNLNKALTIGGKKGLTVVAVNKLEPVFSVVYDPSLFYETEDGVTNYTKRGYKLADRVVKEIKKFYGVPVRFLDASSVDNCPEEIYCLAE